MENLFSLKFQEGKVLPETGTFKNLKWQTVGDVQLKDSEVQLSNAHMDLDLDVQDDQLTDFTLTLNLKANELTGSKQVIFEGKDKGLSLYLDDKGFLTAEIASDQGLKTLQSTVPMPEGVDSTIRVLKYEDGSAELELDGQVIASEAKMGTLKSWGKQKFRLGRSFEANGTAFNGSITAIDLQKGARSSKTLQASAKEIMVLSDKIKNVLNLERVLIHFDFSEGMQKLRRIKQVMQSLGIKTMNDLGTLKMEGSKPIKPGDVFIGRKKLVLNERNWEDMAKAFTVGSIAVKAEVLNKNLGNANSFKFFDIKKAKITPITRRVDLLENKTKVLKDVPQNVKIEGKKWTDLFKGPAMKLELINKTEFKKSFESINPSLWPLLTPEYQVLNGTSVISQKEAVILAKKIDLTNVHLEISSDVETLIIYAEELICGNDAWITWSRPGGYTPGRSDDPYLSGYPDYNRSVRSRDSNNHRGFQGGRAQDGGIGQDGAAGRHAPNLVLWVKDLKNLPNIDLNGENGIQAGQGQRGGRGGNGEGGRLGVVWPWKSCHIQGGNGGRGGDGGNGGNGGQGGVGGNAGNISIGVLAGTLEQAVTQKSFKWKNQGGQPGLGGPGGDAGAGGQGGYGGNGKSCKDALNGDNGSMGKRGYDGPIGQYGGQDGENEFFQFSQHDWDEQMTLPFITSASSYEVFPGDSIILKGTSFSNADSFIYEDTVTLSKNLQLDGSMQIILPNDAKGGAKVIYFRRASDGLVSNRIIVRIKPQLNEYNNPLIPGSKVELTGKAFLDGAMVLMNGQAIPAIVSGNGTILSFEMVGINAGMQVSEERSLQIQNPDGMKSNIRTVKIPGILEIRFKFGHNNLGFKNPDIGKPSWDTFKNTFGSSEVWHESIDPIFGHPILTRAFFEFYKYFLRGEGDGGLATGFCTAMSAKVADNLFKDNVNISTIQKADIITELTAIHGKLLSKESLLYFHDCGKKAGGNIEPTLRQIEYNFLSGCDRNNVPLLFFIPSGEVWDSGYMDKLSSSHCIFPYRIVYPDGHSGAQLSPDGKTTVNSLDGVKLYCWDCNSFDKQDCFLLFKMEDGQLRYSYNNSTGFGLDQGITIAVMTNGAYNLADHDMPFSGPFGLTTFIMDFLLSPADIEITDSIGRRAGNFNGKIYSEIPNSHPCYLLKGAYLLPFGQSFTRNIRGTADGVYTFNSIMPDGAMIKLENMETKKDECDQLMVNADATQIRIKSQRTKPMELTFSRVIDNEIRSISIKGLQVHGNNDVDMTLAPDLSFCRFANPQQLSTVSVQATVVDATKSLKAQQLKNIQVAANSDLVFAMSSWKDMNFQLDSIAY